MTDSPTPRITASSDRFLWIMAAVSCLTTVGIAIGFALDWI